MRTTQGGLTPTSVRTSCDLHSSYSSSRSSRWLGGSTILWMSSMRSWQTPTPEKVSRAVALMVRAEQRRYFFDTLQNPAWLKPLDSKGFFKDPPAAIRD